MLPGNFFIEDTWNLLICHFVTLKINTLHFFFFFSSFSSLLLPFLLKRHGICYFGFACQFVNLSICHTGLSWELTLSTKCLLFSFINSSLLYCNLFLLHLYKCCDNCQASPQMTMPKHGKHLDLTDYLDSLWLAIPWSLEKFRSHRKMGLVIFSFQHGTLFHLSAQGVYYVKLPLLALEYILWTWSNCM